MNQKDDQFTKQLEEIEKVFHLGQVDKALLLLEESLKLDFEPSQKVILWTQVAQIQNEVQQFDKAILALESAYAVANLPDHVDLKHHTAFQLAQLLSHVGRYEEAIVVLKPSLEYFKAHAKSLEILLSQQKLASCYFERGHYDDALKLFREIDIFYKEQKEVFGLAMNGIFIVQTLSLVGDFTEATRQLVDVRDLMNQQQREYLEPYFQLVEARLELLQGKINNALRILESAAHGFEKIDDFPGKVEVLLAMSAPLIEYRLIPEAERIIQILAEWKDLQKYPALEHAIHLRRLALGAFSGNWLLEDQKFLSSKAMQIGRIEDWIQFWFHLALAAKNLGDQENFKLFLKQAIQLAGNIQKKLSGSHEKMLINRPDMIRMHHLIDQESLEKKQNIQAQSMELAEEQAEAATLAPPMIRQRKNK